MRLRCNGFRVSGGPIGSVIRRSDFDHDHIRPAVQSRNDCLISLVRSPVPNAWRRRRRGGLTAVEVGDR